MQNPPSRQPKTAIMTTEVDWILGYNLKTNFLSCYQVSISVSVAKSYDLSLVPEMVTKLQPRLLHK